MTVIVGDIVEARGMGQQSGPGLQKVIKLKWLMPAHVPNDPKITLGHIPDLLVQPLSVTEASSAIKAMY